MDEMGRFDRLAERWIGEFDEGDWDSLDDKKLQVILNYLTRTQSTVRLEAIEIKIDRLTEVEAEETLSNDGRHREIMQAMTQQGIRIKISPKFLSGLGIVLAGAAVGIGQRLGWWL